MQWWGRREVEDVYVLSPMQEGLLFHALYAPESAVYFEQVSCRLAGRLEVESFRRAWAAVIRETQCAAEPVCVGGSGPGGAGGGARGGVAVAGRRLARD